MTYKPLHPIGREGIALDIGGERMGDGAGDGDVGGHERDLADPLRSERTLGEFSLDEVDFNIFRHIVDRGNAVGGETVRQKDSVLLHDLLHQRKPESLGNPPST